MHGHTPSSRLLHSLEYVAQCTTDKFSYVDLTNGNLDEFFYQEISRRSYVAELTQSIFITQYSRSHI